MAQCQWQLNFQKEISWKCRVSINRATRICCFPKRLSIAECCNRQSIPLPLTTTTRRRSRDKVKSQKSDEYETNDLWKVRRVIESEEEMMEVAAIQTDAFYEHQLYSNDFFFQFFKVEQLSNLYYRLKHYAPDRYACLVAEAVSSDEEEQHLVGVIDATVKEDKDILHYIPLATKYIYISGVAVLNKFRRQKVATALLKECDVLASVWSIEYLVLKAYEDDFGARKLYTNAGYKLVSDDAPSKTKWIPERRRVLMVKQVLHKSTTQ
ncbi:GCN5-related N-acetyltransferase 10, chloroplastic-like [Solanum lycopersicum]|uniref:GCN5-related N-acetyltransferase 10, chloroplastic-like n=1 Tax=Solanum lycopersicum TaxID=4081 RepID=UPI003748879E